MKCYYRAIRVSNLVQNVHNSFVYFTSDKSLGACVVLQRSTSRAESSERLWYRCWAFSFQTISLSGFASLFDQQWCVLDLK